MNRGNGIILLSLALTCTVIFVSAQESFLNKDSLLAHVAELASDEYEGRQTEEAGNLKAQEYIIDRFEQIGLDKFGDDYKHTFRFHSRFKGKTFTGHNLIGVVKGTKFSENYIVLSAHFDHVGTRNGKVFNGADDNASGIGALIEIARYLKEHPLRNSVIIAAFDAEEMGLRGADAFTDTPPVSLDSILLNINMDMISRNEQEEIYVCGTSLHPDFRPPLDSLGKLSGIKLKFGHDGPEDQGANNWVNASDHYKFHQKNIPFLYFGVEDHKDYHQPGDDFENIMPEFYFQVSELILQSLIRLDQ